MICFLSAFLAFIWTSEKLVLFPYTELTDWLLKQRERGREGGREGEREFTARYEMNLYMQFRLSFVSEALKLWKRE